MSVAFTWRHLEVRAKSARPSGRKYTYTWHRSVSNRTLPPSARLFDFGPWISLCRHYGPSLPLPCKQSTVWTDHRRPYLRVPCKDVHVLANSPQVTRGNSVSEETVGINGKLTSTQGPHFSLSPHRSSLLTGSSTNNWVHCRFVSLTRTCSDHRRNHYFEEARLWSFILLSCCLSRLPRRHSPSNFGPVS